VYVRGRCVQFSPSIINQILESPDEPYPDIEVSDNKVCQTITASQVKTWPIKKKVPVVKLSQKYAILNRIATANWVPTRHSSDVATGLAKFIYLVGTGTKFNVGNYIFQQTVQHGKSLAVKQPIAFPSILCDIFLSQHPNIRQEGEIAKKIEFALNLHYKLFSEQHVSDIAGPST
ncbi:envelope-like protein, partial [Trifolium medium]|nr:envelope-like protein [Trifolium medium]